MESLRQVVEWSRCVELSLAHVRRTGQTTPSQTSPTTNSNTKRIKRRMNSTNESSSRASYPLLPSQPDPFNGGGFSTVMMTTPPPLGGMVPNETQPSSPLHPQSVMESLLVLLQPDQHPTALTMRATDTVGGTIRTSNPNRMDNHDNNSQDSNTFSLSNHEPTACHRECGGNEADDDDENDHSRDGNHHGHHTQQQQSTTNRDTLTRKKGGQRGVKRTEREADFWYALCEKKESCFPQMTNVEFLRSSVSGMGVSGTLSEQQQFGRRLKLYRKDILCSGTKKRPGMYQWQDAERRIVEYVHQRIDTDGEACMDWSDLKRNALELANLHDLHEYERFQASDTWLHGILQRNGLEKVIRQNVTEIEDSEGNDEDSISDVPVHDDTDGSAQVDGNSHAVPTLVGFLETEEAIEQIRRFGESIQMEEEDLRVLRLFSQKMRHHLMIRMRR